MRVEDAGNIAALSGQLGDAAMARTIVTRLDVLLTDGTQCVRVVENAVPKAFVPLLHLGCDPVAEQAMRRFAGWALALGGAAYAVAWAIAPLSAANMIAAILLGTALLLIIVRLALVMSRRPLS